MESVWNPKTATQMNVPMTVSGWSVEVLAKICATTELFIASLVAVFLDVTAKRVSWRWMESACGRRSIARKSVVARTRNGSGAVRVQRNARRMSRTASN